MMEADELSAGRSWASASLRIASETMTPDAIGELLHLRASSTRSAEGDPAFSVWMLDSGLDPSAAVEDHHVLAARRRAHPVGDEDHRAALRLALTDKSEKDSVVAGDGSAATPWRLPLIGPLALELTASGGVLGIGLGAKTSIDTLGQRCTVVETRIGVKLASIDFAARHADIGEQPLHPILRVLLAVAPAIGRRIDDDRAAVQTPEREVAELASSKIESIELVVGKTRLSLRSLMHPLLVLY